MGWKYNIGVKALKKLTGKKTRNRNFIPFANVHDVLIAWDEYQTQDAVEKNYIDTFILFLEKSGKSVMRVVYYHKRKKENIPAPENDKIYHLSKNDFNAFGMPKTAHVKKLMAQKFDYFINLNMDGRLPLKSIAGFGNATCRIGYNRDNAADFYDLMLGSPDSNMAAFVKDLEYYLQKIG